MAIINLLPFGEINTDELEELYESEIQIAGTTIDVDLNFEDESVDENRIKIVQKFIEDAAGLKTSALDFLLKDFEEGDNPEGTKLFMDHHLEELEEDDIVSVFGSTDIDIHLFLSKLVLRRIGFYPDDEYEFAIFDITLPNELTNYILTVYFDQSGKVSYVSMES